MNEMNINAQTITSLENEFKVLTAENEGGVTVLKSYTEQKAEMTAELDNIANTANVSESTERFKKFCEYGIAQNWAFTVNRTLLCGKKDGTVKGVGMTPAEYTALNDKLTSLSALLLDYISADMAFKNRPSNTSAQKAKEMTALIKRCEDAAFIVYKSVKAVFHLPAKCTRWDIGTLAYLTISIKYRDRSHLSSGWTFGQCSNIALLNKVLRLDSVVQAEGERIKALRQKKDSDKVKKTAAACLDELKTELKDAQPETAESAEN